MFVVGGIVLAVIFGLLAAFPQAWWRISSAWAYRNPDANEPSDLAYGIQRVVAGVLAVIALVAGISLQVTTTAQDDRAARCTAVKRLADGVAASRADALTSRLEDRGYTVDRDSIGDLPMLTVTRDGDEVATVYWADQSADALIDCSS